MVTKNMATVTGKRFTSGGQYEHMVAGGMGNVWIVNVKYSIWLQQVTLAAFAKRYLFGLVILADYLRIRWMG